MFVIWEGGRGGGSRAVHDGYQSQAYNYCFHLLPYRREQDHQWTASLYNYKKMYSRWPRAPSFVDKLQKMYGFRLCVQGYDFQTYFTGKWRGENVKYFEYITMALKGPLQELCCIVLFQSTCITHKILDFTRTQGLFYITVSVELKENSLSDVPTQTSQTNSKKSANADMK